jgi:hypothetical protein
VVAKIPGARWQLRPGLRRPPACMYRASDSSNPLIMCTQACYTANIDPSFPTKTKGPIVATSPSSRRPVVPTWAWLVVAAGFGAVLLSGQAVAQAQPDHDQAAPSSKSSSSSTAASHAKPASNQASSQARSSHGRSARTTPSAGATSPTPSSDRAPQASAQLTRTFTIFKRQMPAFR